MERKKRKRSNMMIVRMAEVEHARLKIWAHERGTNMSSVIRDRVADIITPSIRAGQHVAN
jgi:hypothetical protein